MNFGGRPTAGTSALNFVQMMLRKPTSKFSMLRRANLIRSHSSSLAHSFEVIRRWLGSTSFLARIRDCVFWQYVQDHRSREANGTFQAS
jgi:hypothetical protein